MCVCVYVYEWMFNNRVCSQMKCYYFVRMNLWCDTDKIVMLHTKADNCEKREKNLHFVQKEKTHIENNFFFQSFAGFWNLCRCIIGQIFFVPCLFEICLFVMSPNILTVNGTYFQFWLEFYSIKNLHDILSIYAKITNCRH